MQLGLHLYFLTEIDRKEKSVSIGKNCKIYFGKSVWLKSWLSFRKLKCPQKFSVRLYYKDKPLQGVAHTLKSVFFI